MSTYDLFTNGWDWKPSVVIGCLALIAAYGALTVFRSLRRTTAWAAGVLLILVVLVSPLDTLADSYLFSAHMAKHMLLVLVIPALLWLGVPDRAGRLPAIPAPICWLAGIGVMILWHIPPLFNTALEHEPLHILEHLSLLAGGTLYWYPIMRSRLAPVPHAAAYLFTSCLACTMLGVTITFASTPLYTAYLHPAGPFASLVRNGWGISNALDQQMGGILMWVPGCLVYLTGIMAMFARWYGEENEIARTHA